MPCLLYCVLICVISYICGNLRFRHIQTIQAKGYLKCTVMTWADW
jgi:hypothetical protein